MKSEYCSCLWYLHVPDVDDDDDDDNDHGDGMRLHV
jgi:hypothetical protein